MCGDCLVGVGGFALRFWGAGCCDFPLCVNYFFGGFGGCGVWLISVCLVECCYSGGLRYGFGLYGCGWWFCAFAVVVWGV